MTKYIDENGNVVAAYEYDDFGRTISQAGAMADFFRHRFSTKYIDSEIGLYYYGYRFYSPSLMRWLNRDPIDEEGGLNLYGFCGNSCVRYFDVLGECDNRPPIDSFFNDAKGRFPVRISAYVSVALRELRKLASGRYHYRVVFIPRFTPPPEVEARRIKQSRFSKLLWGDANRALGGETGMYEPSKDAGDVPASAWGKPEASDPEFHGVSFQYGEKLFQFGYFAYKKSGRKGNYERISANPDMYTAWSVGGATRLLPSSDISESGDLDKCDKLQIQYGDRGYPPLTLWVVPEK